MEKLTKRELNILEFIRKNKKAGNAEIVNYLASISSGASRITIIRSINALIKAELVERKGEGRSVYYEEKSANPLLAYFDIEEYFKKSPDERSLAFERFNFGIFDSLGGIFSEGESEILIKENKEAEGHKKKEATMILNHKKALEYIIGNRNEFKNLTLKKIEDVHGLIVDGLSVAKGLRKKAVGITGTKYRPLDNEYQIREMMGKTVEVVNKKLNDPFSKAIFTTLMISYIQPFEDGNKRASRLLGNAILLANNACPLSYRSVNEADYKKAVILFYEQNSARFFKELFIEQFKFAVSNYFLA
ncbi:MAG: hypothetical protein UT90_C0016G0034 [Parcubacteria group bacterium GW2011_GWA1_40_21]|nr:MAG: hypothetical protein UT90_C0016G0034 [Parcubacteria group bacterium GW2011_GWA1_40_21]